MYSFNDLKNGKQLLIMKGVPQYLTIANSNISCIYTEIAEMPDLL